MLTLRYAVIALLTLGFGVLAYGQAYPNKPIRIITGGASSATGFMARTIAQSISGPLGQPLVIENRGGNETLYFKNALPDGYTMLISGSGVWVAAATGQASYDPAKDFAPIAWLGKSPFVVYITPSLPVKTVKDLIAYAKARPGQMNASISGIGSAPHLATELFKSLADVNIVGVPYSNGSQELADLISGQIQLVFSVPASYLEQVRSGRLRALAVTSPQRSAVLPDLPTLAEAGVPGYQWTQTQAMFAPGKTPAPIIKRMNQEVVRALQTPEVKELLLRQGIEVIASSPEELETGMKTDMARVAKIVKDSHIVVQ